MNQLWGIPLLGVMVRALLCLPHYIILALWGMLVFLVYLVVWIPILLRGRYPSWAFGFVGGFVRWTMRVTAYILLMTAAYPPFSTQPGYAVEVDFDEEQDINPLWGIPILGIFARFILAIPHLVVLWLLGFVVGVLNLIVWIPVLLTGRYPSWGYALVGGYYRWYVRVWAYVGLMAAPYPPFTTR
jgi:hypothetical protein